MNSEIEKAVEKFVRENPDAKSAFGAMRQLGRTRKEATAELAMVLSSIRDAWDGVPDALR